MHWLPAGASASVCGYDRHGTASLCRRIKENSQKGKRAGGTGGLGVSQAY